ncbi:MAG TPA: hypothetical protein VMD27_13870 [Candidatus Aquilonibacter sp.]|nr:hypothetical protein [Candidatus Aquilonibacter sp.]
MPILSSRSAQLGGTVATVGFPDIGLLKASATLSFGFLALNFTLLP